jgi:phytoene dehydrogenase-like protein
VLRFPYGPAVAKVDLALCGPVPWADPALARAVTVHVGGSAAEVVRAEADVANGRVPRHPYVIAVQPSVLDPSRAPAGSSVLWAYAHVPNGSAADPSGFVVDRLEQFAPGLQDRVLAVHATPASAREAQNPAAIGGDISGGAITMRQAIVRPVLSRHPWRTPLPGVYLCSASTPPGPAVHGRGGWLAAQRAVEDATGRRITLDDVRERTAATRAPTL